MGHCYKVYVKTDLQNTNNNYGSINVSIIQIFLEKQKRI